jgi:hypothetical protein
MVDVGISAPCQSVVKLGFPQPVSGASRKYPVKSVRIALQLMLLMLRWNQGSYRTTGRYGEKCRGFADNSAAWLTN